MRLLQFILPAPVTRLPVEAGEVPLCRKDRCLRFSPALVQMALSRGLAVETADGLAATPEARSLLRRLLSAADAPFQAQHGPIETAERLVEGERVAVRVVRQSESALGSLPALKDRSGEPYFPEPAVAAAERLLSDFTFAGLSPRITASWQPRLDQQSRGGRGAQAELSEQQLDARSRLDRACHRLGPELTGVALDVCCFGKGLEQVERERHWPARSAKLMLRTALMALARHYGCG